MADRIAVLELYTCTNGVRWINSMNWLTELPSSLWYGISINEVIWWFTTNFLHIAI